MKTYLLPVLLVALPATAHAQCVLDPINDLQLTATPTLAAPGQPITVELKNNSAACVYELPTPCLILAVRNQECDGDEVLLPICLPSTVPIPPGTSVTEVWDQLDDGGGQVADGLYAFEVQVLSPSGTLFELCTSAQIGTGCTSPFAYGQGTSGSGGFGPNLSGIGGPPQIGSASFGVAVTNGLGGSTATVFASLGTGSLDLGFGTILIDPGQLVLSLPVALSAGGPGQGIGLLTTPVPPSPVLIGLEVFFQAAVSDPGGPGGVALTHGLRAAICP